VNLPMSLNETSAADDITGKNACPIWLRITAMMQAAPFEADPMEDKRKSVEAARFTALMHSEKHRVKKNSFRVWVTFRHIFYECATIVAFARLILGVKGSMRGKSSAVRRAAMRAKNNGKPSFTYKGYTGYLKKPEGAGVPVRYVGIDFP